MGLLDRIRGGRANGPEVRGVIGYYHLGEWWVTTFTEEERGYIEEKYGKQDHPLTQGHITQRNQTPVVFLVMLSTWLTATGDRHLATRMLVKADSLAGSNVVDRHFVYSEMVKMFYAERERQPGMLEATIVACERQIAIGPQALAAWISEYPSDPPIAPSHRGFVQLAIIREKQGDLAEALRLCREAQSQGWRDGKSDWSKRISRLERRLSKTG